MGVYEEFEDEVKNITNIQEALEVLHWDQNVMMPENGVRARSGELAILSKVKHNRLTAERLGQLLDQLESEDLSESQRAVVREIKRQHDRAVKVPDSLIQEMSQKESESLDAWHKAKEEDDFEIFRPHLEEMVELKRKYAEHIDPDSEPYKVLFKDYEPYLRFETMEEILHELKDNLTPFLEKIKENGKEIETGAFKGDFNLEKQEEMNRELAELIGYDFSRGRLDSSAHPFTAGNQFDCRITTRYSEANLMESILPTIHEAGHAMYEQGLPQDEYGTPLGQSRDLSIHESQSRLWENHVGRSKSFQEFVLENMNEYFPELEDVSVQDAYESVNQVYERNPIRVNSDELTYHLHIVLRFELERKLINGDIEVEELPELWDGKMEELFGFKPKTDAEGVLQDVHWSQGSIGYFPTYSLGSVIAAQLFNTIEDEVDDIDQKIENGNFEPLLEWLRENIHRKGCLYKTEELVEKATGEKPTAEYFLEYIRQKYSEIYGLGN